MDPEVPPPWARRRKLPPSYVNPRPPFSQQPTAAAPAELPPAPFTPPGRCPVRPRTPPRQCPSVPKSSPMDRRPVSPHRSRRSRAASPQRVPQKPLPRPRSHEPPPPFSNTRATRQEPWEREHDRQLRSFASRQQSIYPMPMGASASASSCSAGPQPVDHDHDPMDDLPMDIVASAARVTASMAMGLFKLDFVEEHRKIQQREREVDPWAKAVILS